jgi:DNA segregation ATPase FtsK/SpoIIIE-like protein
MNTTNILLSIVIVLQVIILFFVLKPYMKGRFERMSNDKLLKEVIEDVKKNRKVSTSYLQRKFSLGYARSALMMDRLEEEGIIGESKGAEPRDILLNK